MARMALGNSAEFERQKNLHVGGRVHESMFHEIIDGHCARAARISNHRNASAYTDCINVRDRCTPVYVRVKVHEPRADDQIRARNRVDDLSGVDLGPFGAGSNSANPINNAFVDQEIADVIQPR